jgi:ribosomal protein L23
MKAAALRGALSDRARAGARASSSTRSPTGDAPSTKAARKVIEGLVSDAGHRVLAVVGRENVVSQLSLRNLQAVHLIAPDQLNTYDVLVNDVVLFTEESLETFLAGPVAAPTLGRRGRAAGAGEEGPRRWTRPTTPTTPPTAAEPLLRWPTARRPRASPSRATRTRCSTTCRAARSHRGGGLVRHRRGREAAASSCRSQREKEEGDILLAPVVSEKSYGLLEERQYTFLVKPDANKTEIKIAVEKVFGVKVLSVNTLNRNGQAQALPHRLRQAQGHEARDRHALRGEPDDRRLRWPAS